MFIGWRAHLPCRVSQRRRAGLHHFSLRSFLAARRRTFSAIEMPTPGSDQGQTAIQIAQPEVSAKYGMHLSKSTYHFSTPRTNCLSGDIAAGGQAFSQTLQRVHTSSIPKSLCSVNGIGASVSTADRRKAEPNSELIMEPCLPNSPKPQAMAGGIIAIFPVIGPVTGSAR